VVDYAGHLCILTTMHHRLTAGIPRDHPESYHSFMWNHLFKHIDIDPKNAHILDGNAPDLQAECDKFENLISEAGGIELFIGGSCALLSVVVYGIYIIVCRQTSVVF